MLARIYNFTIFQTTLILRYSVMQWLFFTILPLLSAFKVTAQGYFSKGKVNSVLDTIKLNGFIFLYSAISLTALTVRQLPSVQTVLFALFVSILTIAFQCFYVLAFKSGAVSLSTTIVNFGVALPIIYSIVFLGEKVTTFKIIGFILIALALILLPSGDKNPNSKGIKTTKRWFLFVIVAMLCTGAINICQNVFASSNVANEKEVFTALIYAFASIICFILLPIFKSKIKAPLYKGDIKTNVGLILIGLVLGVYNLLVVSALTFIPATIYFPTTSGLQILTAVIVSSITFKEFPSIKQIIGIAVTVAAVVIINLQ